MSIAAFASQPPRYVLQSERGTICDGWNLEQKRKIETHRRGRGGRRKGIRSCAHGRFGQGGIIVSLWDSKKPRLQAMFRFHHESTKVRKREGGRRLGPFRVFSLSDFRDKERALMQGDCVGRRVRNIPSSGFSRPTGNPRPGRRRGFQSRISFEGNG